VQNIKFDILLPRIHAQSQSRVFRVLSESIASFSQTEAKTVIDICEQGLSERVFSPATGLAILDLKSKFVKDSVSALATLETPVKFEAMKGQAIDIIAVILSPVSHGPFHLQKLAPMTRLLAEGNMCEALRGAEDEDGIKALFLHQQCRQSEAA